MSRSTSRAPLATLRARETRAKFRWLESGHRRLFARRETFARWSRANFALRARAEADLLTSLANA